MNIKIGEVLKLHIFYPDSPCRGIVFTHDGRVIGRAGGEKFVRAISRKP